MKKTISPVFISLVTFCSLLCGCNASGSSKLATKPEVLPSVAIESTVATTETVLETLISESISTTEATLPTQTISTIQIPTVPSEQTEVFIEDDEDSLGWS